MLTFWIYRVKQNIKMNFPCLICFLSVATRKLIMIPRTCHVAHTMYFLGRLAEGFRSKRTSAAGRTPR